MSEQAQALAQQFEQVNEELERARELLSREWRTRDVIEHVLIGHVRNHLGSIRETLAATGTSVAR